VASFAGRAPYLAVADALAERDLIDAPITIAPALVQKMRRNFSKTDARQ
jgi:hypothetical protein